MVPVLSPKHIGFTIEGLLQIIWGDWLIVKLDVNWQPFESTAIIVYWPIPKFKNVPIVFDVLLGKSV